MKRPGWAIWVLRWMQFGLPSLIAAGLLGAPLWLLVVIALPPILCLCMVLLMLVNLPELPPYVGGSAIIAALYALESVKAAGAVLAFLLALRLLAFGVHRIVSLEPDDW